MKLFLWLVIVAKEVINRQEKGMCFGMKLCVYPKDGKSDATVAS